MKLAAIMPTYNQADFLVEAIESVRSQVDLLVVVDDASTDGTWEILNARYRTELRMDYVLLPQNRGAAGAINAGAQRIRTAHAARPEWLTWVSSDNVAHPDWAESLLECAVSGVGMVYSGYNARGDIAPHYNFRPYDPAALGSSIACYIGPSFIIRADCWPDHRGRHCHDYDHFLRVEEACWEKGLRVVGLDRPLYTYRVHRGMATRNHRAGDFDATHWLREAQARRKAAGIVPPAA